MTTLTTYHNIVDLFKQLGLPNSPDDIESFFKTHAPLSENIDIWNAPWWNKSQSQFLHDELIADANWQVVIDELNSRLRKHS